MNNNQTFKSIGSDQDGIKNKNAVLYIDSDGNLKIDKNRSPLHNEEWEAFNDSLVPFRDAVPATLSGKLKTSETYQVGTNSITKSFNYTGKRLDSIVFSGDLPADLQNTTKTFIYSGKNEVNWEYS